MNRPSALWMVLVASALSVHAPALGQTASIWTNPAGGSWTDGANWSTVPEFPENGTDQFHAIIDLTGAGYLVDLAADISLSDFTLNSPSATLLHRDGTLRILGTASLAAGEFRLDGGTIEGGVWNLSGASLTPTSNSANRLRGVTLTGNLDMALPNARLRVADGLSMAGTLTLSGSSAQLTSENTQTFSGGTLRFDAASMNDKLFTIASGTTTIAGTQRITGGRGIIDGSGTLVNNGLIRADASGQSIAIRPQNFVNNVAVENGNSGNLTIGAAGRTWTNAAGGSITGNGGAITFAGTWQNQGTIASAGSAVTLGGNFATASLAGFSRTGGTVDLTGILDNTGSTLALNSATGTWRLTGGQIRSGTLAGTAGSRLQPGRQTANLLDGVNVGDVLDFSAGGYVRATPSTFFMAPINLTGSSARLGLDSGHVFGQTLNISGSSELSAEGSGDVILDSNSVVQSAAGRITSGRFASAPNVRMINRGRITGTGSTLSIDPVNFVNEGLIESTGSSTVRLGSNGTTSTAWANTGTLRTANTSILELNGRFRTADLGTIERAGGAVRLTGVLDNTGATLTFNDNTGSWDMQGSTATIRGGTINTTPTAGINFGTGENYLDGVTYNGDIRLGQSTTAWNLHLSPTTVINGRFTGTAGALRVDAGGVYNLDIEATDNFAIDEVGSGTVTFGPGFSLATKRGGIAAPVGNGLINQGSIVSTGTATGTTLTIISRGFFRNEGIVRSEIGQSIAIGQANAVESPRGDVLNASGGLIDANAGRVLLGGRWSNEGTLRVRNNGTLVLIGEFSTPGIGLIDRQGGTVELSGALNNQNSTLHLDQSTGIWSMKGGTITGGMLDLSAGPFLQFNAGSSRNNELRNVTISGPLDLTGSNGTVYVYGGLTGASSVIMPGRSRLTFAENTSLSTPVLMDFVYEGSYYPSQIEMPDGVTLTLVSGGEIRGRGGLIGSGYGSAFTNEGTVHADSTGLPLRLSAGSVQNRGLLLAENGATLRIDHDFAPGISWTNESTGLFRGVDSTIGVFETTQDSRSRGTNFGVIDADGGTLLLGGNWTNEGAITASNGALVTLGTNAATESAWANNGLIQIHGSTIALNKRTSTAGGVNRGQIRLQSTNGQIDADWRNEGLLRLDESSVRVVPTNLRNFAANTLTGGEWIVGPGSTLTMDSAAISTNAATIELISAASSFPALNSLRQNDGELRLTDRDLNLSSLTNSGMLKLGAGSLLSIAGSFEQEADAFLRLTIADLDTFGAIAASTATVAGSLEIVIEDDWQPSAGDSFGLLAGNSIFGIFDSVTLPPLAGGLSWSLDYSAVQVTLNVVPEPQPVFAFALSALVLILRRR